MISTQKLFSVLGSNLKLDWTDSTEPVEPVLQSSVQGSVSYEDRTYSPVQGSGNVAFERDHGITSNTCASCSIELNTYWGSAQSGETSYSLRNARVCGAAAGQNVEIPLIKLKTGEWRKSKQIYQI